MCENRDGKFVVPIRPGAGRGWVIGQVVRVFGSTLRSMNGSDVISCVVSLVWVEKPEYQGGDIISMSASQLREFDSFTQAMEHLRSMGVAV